MGKMYKETKKEQGGDRGNQYTAPKGNNFPLPTTAERIAEQFNVSDRTGSALLLSVYRPISPVGGAATHPGKLHDR